MSKITTFTHFVVRW